MIAYIIIAMTYVFLDRRVNRADRAIESAVIALPLAVASAFGTLVLALTVFKAALIIFGLLCLLVAKLKVAIGLKIAAIIGSLGLSAIGIALGPIGWGLLIIVFLLLAFVCFVHFTQKFYELYVNRLGRALLWIRCRADAARHRLPTEYRFIVLSVEVPMVCGLSVYGMWKLMNWFDGHNSLTTTLVLMRCVCLVLPVLLMYRAYLRDTRPPETGGDGIDVPGPIDTADVIGSVVGLP